MFHSILLRSFSATQLFQLNYLRSPLSKAPQTYMGSVAVSQKLLFLLSRNDSSVQAPLTFQGIWWHKNWNLSRGNISGTS